MPSQSGLELLISRNNPDEQDDDDSDDFNLADLGNVEEVPDFIKQQLQGLDDNQSDEPVDEGSYIDAKDSHQQAVVIKLADFEDLISLASVLRLEGGASDLYQYKMTTTWF